MKRRILHFSSIPFAVLLFAIVPTLSAGLQVVQGVPVSAEFQAWADGNNDRILQPRECEELVGAVLRFLGEPHPAVNSLDTFLDVNRDGKIGPDEIERAWVEIILPRLQRLLPGKPRGGAARRRERRRRDPARRGAHGGRVPP